MWHVRVRLTMDQVAYLHNLVKPLPDVAAKEIQKSLEETFQEFKFHAENQALCREEKSPDKL